MTTSLIDKVFVINLDKDKERLLEMDKQLRQAKIPYQRFPAILGSEVSNDPRLTTFCSNFCADGMKGCALSHHTLWERAIANEYKTVMILEDDVEIPADINEKLDSLFLRVEDDWDVLFVGCRLFCNDETLSSKLSNRLILQKVPKDHDKYIKEVGGSLGTHAIIYKTSFLKKILNEPINGHIDHELIKWIDKYKAKAYGLYPEIIPLGSNHTTSSLSDTYPPLLISALNTIDIADHIPLGWVLSETMYKVGYMNVTTLLAIIFLLGIFLPFNLLYWIIGWLLVEFLVSLDYKNCFKFLFFLAAGFGINVVRTTDDT